MRMRRRDGEKGFRELRRKVAKEGEKVGKRIDERRRTKGKGMKIEGRKRGKTIQTKMTEITFFNEEMRRSQILQQIDGLRKVKPKPSQNRTS